MAAIRSDLEIARAASLKPINEIAEKLGLTSDHINQYGRFKAKVDATFLGESERRGKLILVTGISPTPAGEGKSTTTVGLGDAINRIGKNASICLREPSLGPCFGIKGGAAGGGYAQVVPMEDINLHFTGDFHAITSAHNLLSALIDNHIYWGNSLNIDARRISWRRVIDLNDRALRSIVSSLGGTANGFPRETGFDITVASEIMAIFCLATNLKDLGDRIGRIQIGETRSRATLTARDLEADGPMTVLLKEAFLPNLVQTLEHTPAFVHGGPFANIAHGCNSVSATNTALALSDYVVTEAGFGSDLGAEKFFNIKCRSANLFPDAVTLVATVRAIKMHGGVSKEKLKTENLDALRIGMSNVIRHIENMNTFGVPVVVSINRFLTDTNREINLVKDICAEIGTTAIECNHWAEGGRGAEELANAVVLAAESKNQFKYLYPDEMPLWEKIQTIATKIYRARSVTAPPSVLKQLKMYEGHEFGRFPICMAKTPLSFSTDPKLLGAPNNFDINIREIRLSAGAGFIVAICGNIMTMPGLPRTPSAASIRLDTNGEIEGLF
ncbi:MAG: formate--tetrahydrofolate ligase [Rhodospirillaceae bacterium]|nr:formate--tetrahydrofolate ligase [Rhodospirillaceae bacterium]